VDRWNLSFGGEDDVHSVDDFVFHLEFLQRQHQCPWNEVLRNFHVLLSGRAKERYWVHVRQSRVDTCAQLRRAQMDRFRGHQTKHERMHELLQREQQPGESADDYISPHA